MSQKKFKEKYNDGCIKVFKLLQLFYEDKAKYDDVMEIFSNEEFDLDKDHVTLNKFLNTLKIFGMKLYKKNNKFYSLNLPFTMDLDLDDLKAVSIFAKVAQNMPNGKAKENLQAILEQLKIRFNERAFVTFDSISRNDKKDYSFYYSNLREQIELCESFCHSNFKIHLTYLDSGKEVVTYCNAQQVVFDNKNAYLRIFKSPEQVVKDVLITNIVEIKYAPTQKKENEIAKTVVFKLKGHLAKAYTLHENEILNQVEQDGSIIIVNSKEPVDSLLKRLMRYDCDCIIEGPKELRSKMYEQICDTLKNYE